MESHRTLGTGTSRRRLIGKAGFGAALALASPGLFLGGGRALRAQAPAAPIMRPIPSTGEMVPAVGLGTFVTFDLLPGAKRDHLALVLRRFWEGGGRLVDTSPVYGMAEVNVGDFASALGIGDQLIIANKIWSTGEFLGDDSHALRSLETSMQRLWRERLDLMQCHSLVNVDVVLPILQAWKKEGRIRYVGASHHELPAFDALAGVVGRGGLDVVQVRYSIATRKAEERILPAATANGVAVAVNMPFEKARLFKLVEGREVPGFARELGIESWSHFFLKWAISHPAVTYALPATADPDHAAQNLGAMRGELPDARMRQQMVRHMETIPGFDRLEQMPWYPGKRYPGVIARAQAELRARA